MESHEHILRKKTRSYPFGCEIEWIHCLCNRCSIPSYLHISLHGLVLHDRITVYKHDRYHLHSVTIQRQTRSILLYRMGTYSRFLFHPCRLFPLLPTTTTTHSSSSLSLPKKLPENNHLQSQITHMNGVCPTLTAIISTSHISPSEIHWT